MLKKGKLASILVLLIAAAMLATACSGGSTGKDNEPTPTAAPTDEPTAEPTEAPEGSQLPEADMGGYVFTVADTNPARWIPEAGSSDLANAVLDRIKWVEEKYNCKFEYKPHSEEEIGAAIMAGDKYADFFITTTWEMARHMVAGRVVDLKTVPNLDLTQDYWTKHNEFNLYTYNDKTYGAAAPFADQAEEIWIMVYNKAIIEELGLEDPYELVKNKQWTFEKMLEMQQAAKADLNGDNVFDSNDRYGLATGHDWDISVAMYIASGNKIYDAKPDGSIEFALNTPKAIETMNMLKKMLKRGDTFFPKDDGEDMDAYVKAFTEGKVLFLAYSRGYGMLDPIYSMEDDFGIIPMPMGNNTDKYLNWVSHNAPVMGVPITNTELEKTGLVLEALAYKARNEAQISEDEYALTKARDDESMETITNLRSFGTSDFALLAQQMHSPTNQSLWLLPSVCFYDQSLEPVSEVERLQEPMNVALDELELLLKGEPIETPAEGN